MEKVVIVDDEVLAVEYLKQMIDWKQNHCEIAGTASTAMQALTVIKEISPDILFLDIEMPSMNGLDLAAQVREMCPACTIIILTAYEEFSYAQKAVRLGIFDYIVKHELTEEKLTGILAAVIKERQKGVLRENAGKEKLLAAIYAGRARMPVAERLLSRQERGCCIVIRDNSPFSARESGTVPVRGNDIIMITANDRERLVLLKFGDQVKAEQQNRIKKEFIEEVFVKCREEGVSLPVFLISDTFAEAEAVGKFGRKIRDLGKGILLGGTREIRERDFGTVRELYLRNWETIREKVERFLYSGEMAGTLDIQELFEDIPSGRAILRNPEVIIMFRDYFYNFMERQKGTDIPDFRQKELTVIRDVGWIFQQNLIIMRNAIENRGTERSLAVYQAEKFICQHYNREIRQAEIAEAVGLSEGYLRNMFKKEKGISLREYLQQVRIENAMKLLATRKYKIYEVAELCGFSTGQYFSMVFQNVTGLTPTEYANGVEKNDKKQFQE